MVFALFPGFGTSSRDYARSAVSKRGDDANMMKREAESSTSLILYH